jgi:hypothetical protein
MLGKPLLHSFDCDVRLALCLPLPGGARVDELECALRAASDRQLEEWRRSAAYAFDGAFVARNTPLSRLAPTTTDGHVRRPTTRARPNLIT